MLENKISQFPFVERRKPGYFFIYYIALCYD